MIKPSSVIRLLHWIFLGCVIGLIIFVRIRILATPLERDEGEYAYMGQLLLQGVPPFTEAFNMKLPGTSLMYALFMLLFGQNVSAIHLGLMLINIASACFTFIIAKKITDVNSAIVSTISFTLLSLSPLFLGFAAHATHFVIFFILGGIAIILSALELKRGIRVFFSGILFGCAFLMKQPGIFFLFFGISMLGILGPKQDLSRKQLFKYGVNLFCGFLIPVVIVLLVIYFMGAFDRFWFWVVQYALYYGSDISLGQGMLKMSRMLILFWKGLAIFCIFVAIGSFLLMTEKVNIIRKNFLLSFLLFSFLSLLPGLQFRYHYFILILPACAFFIGSGYHMAQRIFERTPKWHFVPMLIFAVAVGENVFANTAYYYTMSPTDIVRKYYSVNHFAESIPISEYIVKHTKPDERIAVVGSEPQIFFYTKRRSVSGHIYMYGMMEPQPFARRMQEEFIADVERAKPNYLVFFGIPCSWGDDLKSDYHIFAWKNNYTSKFYNLVSVIDLLDINKILYVWGEDARKYSTVSQNSIFIYERIKMNRTVTMLNE